MSEADKFIQDLKELGQVIAKAKSEGASPLDIEKLVRSFNKLPGDMCPHGTTEGICLDCESVIIEQQGY